MINKMNWMVRSMVTMMIAMVVAYHCCWVSSHSSSGTVDGLCSLVRSVGNFGRRIILSKSPRNSPGFRNQPSDPHIGKLKVKACNKCWESGHLNHNCKNEKKPYPGLVTREIVTAQTLDVIVIVGFPSLIYQSSAILVDFLVCFILIKFIWDRERYRITTEQHTILWNVI
jgi:hypothetical protein